MNTWNYAKECEQTHPWKLEWERYMKIKRDYQIEQEALRENFRKQIFLATIIKQGRYTLNLHHTCRQTKHANDGRVHRGTLRPYILITLGHAERREPIPPEQLTNIVRQLFLCSSIVITKEAHQEQGWHIHIAIKNSTASKNNATEQIRKAFSRFEGRQCNVTFHKGFAHMIGYVTKQDKDPYVWGEYTKEEILTIGETARRKKKCNTKPVQDLLQKITECTQWLEVYNHIEVSERLLYGSYSNVRRVFRDLQLLHDSKQTPLQRIQAYLDQREVEKRGLTEYSPEEILEKYPLLDWIACNLIYQRPLKTKQLLLYGPPSTQKTLIFHMLRKALRIYFVGVRMNDFAGADDYYDLWVFDEFHNHERVGTTGEILYSENANVFNNTMLRVLDGQECRLDAKYGEVINKKRNVPIILIANTIPTKIKSYGPMQERVMRLRFSSRIPNIDEERLILTLKGCILRRMPQPLLQNHPQQKAIELQYNQENALLFEQNEEAAIERPLKEKRRLLKGTTDRNNEIQLVFERTQAAKGERMKTTAKILINPEQLKGNGMSTLQYAPIPIQKDEKIEKAEQFLMAFKSTLPGANFKIFRNEDTQVGDYLIWPIRLLLMNKKEVCHAEIIIHNQNESTEKGDEQGTPQTSNETNDFERINIQIGTCCAMSTKNTAYHQQQGDFWETQQWDDHD